MHNINPAVIIEMKMQIFKKHLLINITYTKQTISLPQK